MGERFNTRKIVFDRWGAVQMEKNFKGMGFTVVPFGQGFKDMSSPTKELIKLTLEQKLTYSEHPVLRRMMNNIFICNDPAGNIKADQVVCFEMFPIEFLYSVCRIKLLWYLMEYVYVLFLAMHVFVDWSYSHVHLLQRQNNRENHILHLQ